jgi:Fe2+ transport system protein FeoA
VTPLDQLPVGERRVIAGFLGADAALVGRLVEMGFDEGVEVTVTDIAPGRDPIAVRVGATKVALRRALAALVAVA